MPGNTDIRRLLPKMDKLVSWTEIRAMEDEFGYNPVREAAREVLGKIRAELAEDNTTEISKARICNDINKLLISKNSPSLIPVINGTGVVIHTNLGRSPLPKTAEEAILSVASCYSNLEYQLDRGERGERYSHVDKLLCELTGAEAAIVVNNNASAVMLALSEMAKDREVIVSRGELVEIGGSFRIPDVMLQSGARLVEVGTTNRTHPHDYRSAINDNTSLLLKVHTSNFAVVGFKAEVTTEGLAGIGKEAAIPVMVDAGSGCLVDLSRYGIPGEETVQSYLAAGADIVTFSGDKLLGGPQAGLIVGKKKYIDRLKKNQLLRALRIDKLTLAALEATLRLYRDERKAVAEIPTLRMLTATEETLRIKAGRFVRQLRQRLPPDIKISRDTATSSPGGGSFPLLQLPTAVLAVSMPDISPARLEEALRKTVPPVVGRVQKDRFLLDVRTISDNEIPLIASALQQVYGSLK